MKPCTACGKTLPLEDFHVNRAAKSGRCARCKECQNVYQRRWRESHPGLMELYQLSFDARHPGLRRAYRLSYEERHAAQVRAEQEERARERAERREQRRQEQLQHPEVRWERRRHYYAQRAQHVLASNQRYMDKHPDAVRVLNASQRQVRTALRNGMLVRPTTCEACGSTDRKITAAHHDYTKPLDVRWLCWPCHSRWDRQEPKLFRREG